MPKGMYKRKTRSRRTTKQVLADGGKYRGKKHIQISERRSRVTKAEKPLPTFDLEEQEAVVQDETPMTAPQAFEELLKGYKNVAASLDIARLHAQLEGDNSDEEERYKLMAMTANRHYREFKELTGSIIR